MTIPARFARRAALLAPLVPVALAGAGQVLHVDGDAPPGGDGSSWSSAYASLDDALAQAAELGGAVEVRLAGGVYVPAAPADPGDGRTASFTLGEGLTLLGGYAGLGGPDPDARDVALHETVLSGDRAGDDGPAFENSGENCHHVCVVSGAVVLDGVTITGGIADVENFADARSRGGGVTAAGAALTLRACAVRGNAAYTAGGGVYLDGGALDVADCTFEGNSAAFLSAGPKGGAIYLVDGAVSIADSLFDANATGETGGVRIYNGDPVTVTGCTFSNNQADIGAGLAVEVAGQVRLEDCRFLGNTTEIAAGGAVIALADATDILRCEWADNNGGIAVGGLLLAEGGPVRVANCLFTGNVADFSGGAVQACPDHLTFTNCTFSRNSAGFGAGVIAAKNLDFASCSFGGNLRGHAICHTDGALTVENSVVWGNGASQILADGPVTISSSDVQGGWPGAGNIDEDPLFVQPGTDDLRLADGSPCLDAGDEGLLPADGLDLDGDGDVSEPLPVDLDEALRVLDGAVDMGAYEGPHTAAAPGESQSDVDPDETVILVPAGGEPDPFEKVLVIFTNVSGSPDGAVAAIEFDLDLYPGAGGFSELGSIVLLTTTLDPGEYIMTIMMPLNETVLAGTPPFDVDLTRLNADETRWVLAATGDVQDSPGQDGPVGNLILTEAPAGWGLTGELGDFGVHWNPALGKGFVWAQLDREGIFAFGANQCPTDCAPLGGDTISDVDDLIEIVLRWAPSGPGPGHVDVNRDGVVDVDDLVAAILAWGFCP